MDFCTVKGNFQGKSEKKVNDDFKENLNKNYSKKVRFFSQTYEIFLIEFFFLNIFLTCHRIKKKKIDFRARPGLSTGRGGRYWGALAPRYAKIRLFFQNPKKITRKWCISFVIKPPISGSQIFWFPALKIAYSVPRGSQN